MLHTGSNLLAGVVHPHIPIGCEAGVVGALSVVANGGRYAGGRLRCACLARGSALGGADGKISVQAL